MRDLINLLTESRGLGARRPGEEFVSVTNPEDKIYVRSVNFYPEDRIAYDSYEDMATNLQQIVHAIPGAAVDLIGKFKQTNLAFGIAVFDRPDGTRLAFVKPFTSKAPDPTANNWDNQTGIPGFRYNSKAAAKTQAGMTPQDILVTQPSELDAQGVVNQIVTKFGEGSAQALAAQAVAAGQPFPIAVPAPAGESFSAFTDYFCELLHPIALQTGQYTGNAALAAEKFLAGDSYADCTINFGNDKTEGLSDSILIGPSGQKIKVSSKSGQGAAASAKNLVDAANEVADSNPKLLRKHKDVIELVRGMVQAGQAGAPLELGVKYGIINEDDANDIRGFKKLPKLYSLEDAEYLYSPRMRKLVKERMPKDTENVNVYYHCMAVVAHKVAEYVNENTNFSAAASEILNNGALVQVYTKAKETPTEWILQEFRTIWPGNSVTGVKFSAGKTYYSTGIKGNFTFKILKNGAKDLEDETDEVDNMAAEEPKKKLKDPGASMSADKITKPGRDKRSTIKGVDRARR